MLDTAKPTPSSPTSRAASRAHVTRGQPTAPLSPAADPSEDLADFHRAAELVRANLERGKHRDPYDVLLMFSPLPAAQFEDAWSLAFPPSEGLDWLGRLPWFVDLHDSLWRAWEAGRTLTPPPSSEPATAPPAAPSEPPKRRAPAHSAPRPRPTPLSKPTGRHAI